MGLDSYEALFLQICDFLGGFGDLGRVLCLDLEAVIKSAASADSMTALGVAWERQADGSASGRRLAGALPCNSQAVGEAALAADLITA